MTEASSFTTINTAGDIGSCGWAVPWFNVKILDDSGSSVPSGKVGEIFVESKYPALLTPGYLNAKEATSKLYKFNMLSTGDIGRFLSNDPYNFSDEILTLLDTRGKIFLLGRWKVVCHFAH